MKKSAKRITTWTLSLIAVWLMAACSSGSGGPAIKLGDEFILAPGASVEVDGGDQNLRVDFLSVRSDSRCQAGVQCITAGEAEVMLGLTPEDGGRRSFPVKVSPGESIASELIGYKLTLVRLLPDPPPQDVASGIYRAILVLTNS